LNLPGIIAEGTFKMALPQLLAQCDSILGVVAVARSEFQFAGNLLTEIDNMKSDRGIFADFIIYLSFLPLSFKWTNNSMAQRERLPIVYIREIPLLFQRPEKFSAPFPRYVSITNALF
jgi:hypothetical protein